MLVQDTRGRFASEGDWEPWTFEADDGYDSVGWAAALPGSNCVVGMFGVSYFGNTQWMAALSKPPDSKRSHRRSRNFNTGEPFEDGTHTRTARQQIAHDAARQSHIVLPVIPRESA